MHSKKAYGSTLIGAKTEQVFGALEMLLGDEWGVHASHWNTNFTPPLK